MSSNNRASLLAGLRTGGVRQPLTAAPNVSSFGHLDMPMTANVNGSFNPVVPAHARAQAQQHQQQQQQQAFQMQMMQMEILRLQALQQAQQQQLQVELIRQQQKQQQQAQQQAAVSRQPMSAAPNISSFPNRRVSQVEQLKSQLHLNNRTQQLQQYDELFQAPMTASLGGKFGGRLNPNATTFRMGGFPEEEEIQSSSKVNNNASSNAPATSVVIGQTAVISGGTPLGMNMNSTIAAPAVSNNSPSRGDSSANWRRSSLVGNRSSVTVTVTPPPRERTSPPFGHKGVHRPEPLHFRVGSGAHGLPLVIVDSSEGEFGDDIDDASSSSSTKSEPTTPPSNDSVPPLTTREEAAKRLYEGLGMGRSIPQTAAVEDFSHRTMMKDVKAAMTSVGSTFPLTAATTTTNAAKRVSSQPMRQPLGPPSGVDELSSKNFASRIRRKAIGGLGAMLDARVHRREVEAF